MRINKYIAHAGVASRRKAEELIKQGLVTVNGQVVRELATTIKSGDKVEVEGQPIYNEEKVYYLLNKPRGVISSVTDDKGRKTVVDLLPNVKERIYPVGRLDWDTSGVLMGLARILRCHPWSKTGKDPVPDHFTLKRNSK